MDSKLCVCFFFCLGVLSSDLLIFSGCSRQTMRTYHLFALRHEIHDTT